MADLDTAQRHLARALQRLETALARRIAAADPIPGGDNGALAREVSDLRRECERLNAALREAERENRAIREATETVAKRLDGSIDELDRLLEG